MRQYEEAGFSFGGDPTNLALPTCHRQIWTRLRTQFARLNFLACRYACVLFAVANYCRLQSRKNISEGIDFLFHSLFLVCLSMYVVFMCW